MGTRSTNDPFDQAFGKALKKARVASGLTQDEVNSALSTKNSVGRYESAARTPTPKTLDTLTCLYGVSTDSLLSEARQVASQVNDLKGKNVKIKEEK